MKKVFHKLLSILMAFVVLFSTMSFTVNMHYCGNNLVETAIFQKAKGCGMEMGATTSKSCAIVKKNCCSDDQQIISGQDELQLSVDKVSLDQYIFIATFFNSYNTLFGEAEEVSVQIEIHPPPNIVRSIYKLDESYLI